jgi:GTPase
MFVDEIDLTLKAGKGGKGRVSFRNPPLRGPDGGSGGKGGDVYIEATDEINALSHYSSKKMIEAEDGVMGGKEQRFGHTGKDRILPVPIGSVITDLEDGTVFEVKKGEQLLICKGGLGGRGNYEFRSSTNTTPMYAQPGLPGQIRRVHIDVKLIASFGLIGLPNAGKSSLLNELTGTEVKIAQYPFTTLEPNLGVLNRKILADIPGLIEGASSGKGLGIKFLKHIERTQALIHCIASESEDVLKDYEVIWKELGEYNKVLKEKAEIIVITKNDLVSKEQLKKIKQLFSKSKKNVMDVSIYDYESIEGLKKYLTQRD